MDRRVSAFLIDFGAVAFFSTIGGSALFIPLFIILWLGLRVVLVSKNRGQSLGRWAMDMKVADARYKATPGLAALAQREAITGLGALLVLIALSKISPGTGWVLLLLIPLGVDCSLAFIDTEYRQAFHDRLARTVISQTRRGYSLDIKVKRLFDQVKHRVK